MSPDGVTVNPENVPKVREWPVAKSAKDMERFLGFLNHHREYIKDLLVQHRYYKS